MPMPTDDPAIEAAARRAFEAANLSMNSWQSRPWDKLPGKHRLMWLAVARAAQPPPKLCGTCRWWGFGPDKLEPVRECWAIGTIGLPTDSPSTEEKAGLCTENEAWSALRCRADFGCVLHEATEENR